MGGLAEKLNENCPAAKNTWTDLLSEGKLLNPGAPAQIPRSLCTYSEGDCLACNLVSQITFSRTRDQLLTGNQSEKPVLCEMIY